MKKNIEDIDFSKMDFNTPEMIKHREIISKDMENLKNNKRLYRKICKIELNDENNERDYTFLLLIPLIFILIILISFISYDNYVTKRANAKLKKQSYEYKQQLQRCNEEILQKIIKEGDISE